MSAAQFSSIAISRVRALVHHVQGYSLFFFPSGDSKMSSRNVRGIYDAEKCFNLGFQCTPKLQFHYLLYILGGTRCLWMALFKGELRRVESAGDQAMRGAISSTSISRSDEKRNTIWVLREGVGVIKLRTFTDIGWKEWWRADISQSITLRDNQSIPQSAIFHRGHEDNSSRPLYLSQRICGDITSGTENSVPQTTSVWLPFGSRL